MNEDYDRNAQKPFNTTLGRESHVVECCPKIGSPFLIPIIQGYITDYHWVENHRQVFMPENRITVSDTDQRYISRNHTGGANPYMFNLTCTA